MTNENKEFESWFENKTDTPGWQSFNNETLSWFKFVFNEAFLAGQESMRLRVLESWPSKKEIIEIAKHEDSDGYFGFLSAFEWLQERLEGVLK